MVDLVIHRAFLTDVDVLERPDVATLRVTGPDRVRFLNGMVSNDVSNLAPGQGVMAVKTTNKGRIEGVLRVRALPHAFDLDLLAVAAERVRKSLEQHIIMDDCAVENVTGTRDVVSVFGPRAGQIIADENLAIEPQALAPHAFVWSGPVVVIRDAMLGIEGFEIHTPHGEGLTILERLLKQGAQRASWPDLDVARVEAGVPIDGRDLDDDTIPLEARLERAVSMTKGCYVGQEVIARATNLGGVKHMLVGLLLEGNTPPKEGAALIVPGSDRRTGELSSVVFSPALKRYIALGYVHRTHEQPGTRLDVAGDPPSSATVTELPFVRFS